MQRRTQLIDQLKKQREKLDALIHQIGETPKLDIISPTYDSTTREIERNLLEIRKSFFQNKN